jgi:hypothetical protein
VLRHGAPCEWRKQPLQRAPHYGSVMSRSTAGYADPAPPTSRFQNAAAPENTRLNPSLPRARSMRNGVAIRL